SRSQWQHAEGSWLNSSFDRAYPAAPDGQEKSLRFIIVGDLPPLTTAASPEYSLPSVFRVLSWLYRLIQVLLKIPHLVRDEAERVMEGNHSMSCGSFSRSFRSRFSSASTFSALIAMKRQSPFLM